MSTEPAALNIDETAQHLKSLQEAITNGQEIECWSWGTSEWGIWKGIRFFGPLQHYRPKKVEPVEIVRYVNVYHTSETIKTAFLHNSRADADRYSSGGRIACVKLTVTYVPGQFDE